LRSGVADSGVTVGTVEERPEDRVQRGAVLADHAACGLPGLDLADAGQQPPAQVADRLLNRQQLLSSHVGIEHDARDAKPAEFVRWQPKPVHQRGGMMCLLDQAG
jgi:hypothetical protein